MAREFMANGHALILMIVMITSQAAQGHARDIPTRELSTGVITGRDFHVASSLRSRRREIMRFFSEVMGPLNL